MCGNFLLLFSVAILSVDASPGHKNEIPSLSSRGTHGQRLTSSGSALDTLPALASSSEWISKEVHRRSGVLSGVSHADSVIVVIFFQHYCPDSPVSAFSTHSHLSRSGCIDLEAHPSLPNDLHRKGPRLWHYGGSKGPMLGIQFIW